MRPTAQLRHLYHLAGHTEAVSIRSIVSTLGNNSFALILMLFALLSTVLTPIPGQAMVQSIPMMYLSWQWFHRHRTIKLPIRIAAQTIPSHHFKAGLKKVLPILLWLEKFSRRRGKRFMAGHYRRLTRILIMILCACVALPVPLTHIPPNISLIIIALGELQDDGYMVAVGAIIGALVLLSYAGAGLLLLSHLF